MKKRVLALALLTCICTSGCSKELNIEKPIAASSNIDSYVDAVREESYSLQGNVTLEPGDYVVYPNEGQTCMISDSSVGQEFTTRDFVHVINEIAVNISNGYLLPLDKAPALNGDIVDNGVYLVGFDILPEKNKVGTNAMVVVCEQMPNLFESPIKSTYAKYDEFEAKEGMLVKLSNTHLVSRNCWDVQARTSAFWGSYVNTAIDAAYSATSSLSNDKANYLILYGLALEAKVLEGDIVKLTSDDKISFTYNKKTYNLPYNSAYTVVSSYKKISPNTGTDISTQVYRDYVTSGNDDLGISGNDSTLFYILGDYYTTDTLKVLSENNDISIRYLEPQLEESSPITAERITEVSEGDVVIQPLTNSLQKVSEPMIKLYEAMNEELTLDNKIVMSKSVTVPDSARYGCYRITQGSLNNTEFAYTVNDSSVRLITAGDYIVLYDGCPTYSAMEDTTLQGVSINEVLDYYKRLSTGETSIVKQTTTEQNSNTYKKSYKIAADEVVEIGTTMSANTYTFASATDVTVYPASTGKARVYKKCMQLILQSGDKFTVDEEAIVTAYVTAAMDSSEKTAEAKAKGYTPKTYTINKSFVAGVDMPILEYTVLDDVTVTVGEQTYEKGAVFTPNIGDKVTVSNECTLSAMEPSGVQTTGNRYDVFLTTVGAEAGLPTGEYKIVGGSITYYGETLSVGETISVTDRPIYSSGWFALEVIGTEDVISTEGL